MNKKANLSKSIIPLKNKFTSLLAACMFVFMFASCDESIYTGEMDESEYETSDEIAAYVLSIDGKRNSTSTEFREKGETSLSLKLTKPATKEVTAKFSYDASLLEAYNLSNNSDYALYPKELVTFGNDGVATIASGKKDSGYLAVQFISDEKSDPSVSYVIPVSATITAGEVKSGENTHYLIFVKDLTSIPDAAKSTGIKIISCMEVNDTNPLNNLCFTLKESGKPLIDIVILFSGNINYNAETGRVYNYNNENVQHLLDNREKYLKPLQDRGIKVVLGILGNHDRSGVANLSDETARMFAQELKAVCDAYQLDGIFWDDEYSGYMSPPPPGFVIPSNAAAARLCYETKKAMPDKLMCAYVYSRTITFPEVDGVQPGEFLDWGIHDYGGYRDLSSNYPGLEKSGMALYSQEFARERFASATNLSQMRRNGYGGHMIFAMDPFRPNFQRRQLPALRTIARTLFDDELVYDGKPFEKDW